MTAPGWYDNPDDDDTIRFYDGHDWTQRTRPKPHQANSDEPQGQTPPPPPNEHHAIGTPEPTQTADVGQPTRAWYEKRRTTATRDAAPNITVKPGSGATAIGIILAALIAATTYGLVALLQNQSERLNAQRQAAAEFAALNHTYSDSLLDAIYGPNNAATTTADDREQLIQLYLQVQTTRAEFLSSGMSTESREITRCVTELHTLTNRLETLTNPTQISDFIINQDPTRWTANNKPTRDQVTQRRDNAERALREAWARQNGLHVSPVCTSDFSDLPTN